MDMLSTGHGLVESPRWHAGRLWFSDWIAGEIIAIDDAGASEVIVRHESLPLCFDFRPDGRLVLVSNQRKALLTLEDDGTLVTFADLAALSPLGANDIVIDGRGNAYVNSPNFEFAAGPPDGPVQPGFVAVVTPDGAARVVADDIAFPNGMAVTPDNRTLVVADSYRHHLAGFDIESDGGLSGRRVWADLGDAAPDGICLVRRRAAPAVCASGRGRRGARDGGARPRRLRLHARRRRRNQPLHRGGPVAGDGRPGRRRRLAGAGAADGGRRRGCRVARALNSGAPPVGARR